MSAFDSIFDAWPSTADLAADLAIPESHVRTMRARNSIPPEHWPALIKAAEKRGFSSIDYEMLASARKSRFSNPTSPAEASPGGMETGPEAAPDSSGPVHPSSPGDPVRQADGASGPVPCPGPDAGTDCDLLALMNGEGR